jgi:hypothetical protein
VSRRHWPTLAREPVVGDIVYVGTRAGVVVAVIDGGWRVRYSSGPDHDVRPRGMDHVRPVVVDERDPMVAAPCMVLRHDVRRPHREWRAPTPTPRRRHEAPATWAHLTGTWSWGRSATGVYVTDGGDSMRDVWRPPPTTEAERALWHVESVGLHHGLRELDGDERREAAGYQPDPLERVFEVLR